MSSNDKGSSMKIVTPLKRLFVMVILPFCAFTMPVLAAPKFSTGTAVDGVIVYQDASDTSQFFYLPGRIDSALGVNLRSFKAQYWGIGPTFWGQDSNGNVYSIVGAILAGSANMDITSAQRDAVAKEIRTDYGVQNPKLLPLPLSDTTVTPILDLQTLSMGSQGVTTAFPSNYIFGTDMVFSIGTGNSLFAQVVGARQVGSDVTPNPTFGVAINGKAEFVGDPWRVKVHCDLAQVWHEVRTHVSVGASAAFGWIPIRGAADYQDIQQDLQRSNACTFQTEEGSLDNAKFGRQLFEMMKTIFEAVNTATTEGDGYFKFEPNPHAGDPGGGGASAWLPWSISVNAGRSSASLTQHITFDRDVSYTGRLQYVVPTTMVLAVSCNTATKQYFSDLGNSSAPCITQAKIDTFNARSSCEAKAKAPKLQELNDKLAYGQITQAQFDRLLVVYNRTSFCEGMPSILTARRTFVDKALGSSGLRVWAVQGMTAEDVQELNRATLKAMMK
jgi:hypothetical protein